MWNKVKGFLADTENSKWLLGGLAAIAGLAAGGVSIVGFLIAAALSAAAFYFAPDIMKTLNIAAPAQAGGADASRKPPKETGAAANREQATDGKKAEDAAASKEEMSEALTEQMAKFSPEQRMKVMQKMQSLSGHLEKMKGGFNTENFKPNANGEFNTDLGDGASIVGKLDMKMRIAVDENTYVDLSMPKNMESSAQTEQMENVLKEQMEKLSPMQQIKLLWKMKSIPGALEKKKDFDLNGFHPDANGEFKTDLGDGISLTGKLNMKMRIAVDESTHIDLPMSKDMMSSMPSPRLQESPKKDDKKKIRSAKPTESAKPTKPDKSAEPQDGQIESLLGDFAGKLTSPQKARFVKTFKAHISHIRNGDVLEAFETKGGETIVRYEGDFGLVGKIEKENLAISTLIVGVDDERTIGVPLREPLIVKGAVNADGTLKPKEELRELIKQAYSGEPLSFNAPRLSPEAANPVAALAQAFKDGKFDHIPATSNAGLPATPDLGAARNV